MKLAVELQARQDAVFAPLRIFCDPPGGLAPIRSTLGTLRREFATSGVPIPVAEGSYQSQKDQRESVAELVEAGLVEVFRPNGVKALGYRMTDRGEQLCRLQSGQIGIDDTLALLLRLIHLYGVNHTFSEHDAIHALNFEADHDCIRSRKMLLQEDLSAALSRGWINSACQLSGHCFYTVTPEGKEAAQGGLELPTCARSDRFRPLYKEAFRTAWDAFKSMSPPEPSDIGLLHYPG